MKSNSMGALPRIAYSISEACYAVGISRAHWYNLATRHLAPPTFRAGKRVMVSADSLRDWVKQSEAAEAS